MTDVKWYTRPVFFVSDCAASLAFYGRLGLKEAWRYEEDGRVVALQMDHLDMELILNERAENVGGGRLFVALKRDQIQECVAAFEAAGIEVADGHWGMPVKIIVDPDGNDILFFNDDESDPAT